MIRKKETWMLLSKREINSLTKDDWNFYKNGGCLCGAYGSNECVCGSWDNPVTIGNKLGELLDKRILKLEKNIKKTEEKLDFALRVLERNKFKIFKKRRKNFINSVKD